MDKAAEFMIRVRLPESSHYHSSPSGDTEYEEACRKAIEEKLPKGFAVCPLRMNEKWPKDAQGFTWIRVWWTREDGTASYWIQQTRIAEDELAKLRCAVRKFAKEVGGG